MSAPRLLRIGLYASTVLGILDLIEHSIWHNTYISVLVVAIGCLLLSAIFASAILLTLRQVRLAHLSLITLLVFHFSVPCFCHVRGDIETPFYFSVLQAGTAMLGLISLLCPSSIEFVWRKSQIVPINRNSVEPNKSL